jgi:excisionase family DNA binding protein
MPASRYAPGYLSSSQVAKILHVSPKTVVRWADEGKLPCARTLGGHRRFPERQIRTLREALEQPVTLPLPPS